MNIDVTLIRMLGIAQLVVFAASLLSEQLLKSAVGSGSLTEILLNVSKNIPLLRISNLVALVNCLAIITLGTLFYAVLKEQNKTTALVALSFFVAEAIILAISKIGAYGLISVSQKFVNAGSKETIYFQSMADFLYRGVDRKGYDIHMLFFCMGGMLWYYLLYRSQLITSIISLWGLFAICLMLILVILTLLELDFPPVMILGLPYAPFEVVLGLWLIFERFN